MKKDIWIKINVTSLFLHKEMISHHIFNDTNNNKNNFLIDFLIKLKTK